MPPATKAPICSSKAATASSWVSGPSGANRSPVGPTLPAMAIGRSYSAARSRSSETAALLSSATRSSRPCNASRRALPPNVFVRMMSLPASRKPLWAARIISGSSTFNSSGHPPASMPSAKSEVPMPPSAMSTGFSASKRLKVVCKVCWLMSFLRHRLREQQPTGRVLKHENRRASCSAVPLRAVRPVIVSLAALVSRPQADSQIWRVIGCEEEVYRRAGRRCVTREQTPVASQPVASRQSKVPSRRSPPCLRRRLCSASVGCRQVCVVERI